MSQEMSDEDTISRELFETIVRECLEVLKKHGFTPQPTLPPTPSFDNIFEDICFGFFGNVVPKTRSTKPLRARRKTNLKRTNLDHITLECALVFLRHGLKSVRYNESLNHIRGAVADVLVAMGYESVSHLCMASQPPSWLCYRLWVEVARQDGESEEKIAEARRWAKEEQSQYFEYDLD